MPRKFLFFLTLTCFYLLQKCRSSEPKLQTGKLSPSWNWRGHRSFSKPCGTRGNPMALSRLAASHRCHAEPGAPPGDSHPTFSVPPLYWQHQLFNCFQCKTTSPSGEEISRNKPHPQKQSQVPRWPTGYSWIWFAEAFKGTSITSLIPQPFLFPTPTVCLLSSTPQMLTSYLTHLTSYLHHLRQYLSTPSFKIQLKLHLLWEDCFLRVTLTLFRLLLCCIRFTFRPYCSLGCFLWGPFCSLN